MQIEDLNILVVAAHPDDEILGVGASIHKWVNQHHCTARAVILGEGLTSRNTKIDHSEWGEDLKEHRRHMKNATERVGYSSCHAHDFPDNKFDSVPLLDIVQTVESEIQDFKPDLVLTHHSYDLNVDHRLTSQAVVTALRPQPNSIKPHLMTFQTLSVTEWQLSEPHLAFLPNCFVALKKEDLSAKQEALGEYKFEIRDYPHPRSAKGIEILARHWGMVVGEEFCEAFKIIRSFL